jgi:Mg/Co/Ni transporter MgtE
MRVIYWIQPSIKLEIGAGGKYRFRSAFANNSVVSLGRTDHYRHHPAMKIEWDLIAATAVLSLISIVQWGTFAGSMLPFSQKLLELAPATS